MVREMEKTPFRQNANKNNFGTVIPCWPWREHCVVSSLCHCSKRMRRLPFIMHLQHGWDTHAFWASVNLNTGIQWELNSASKALAERKSEASPSFLQLLPPKGVRTPRDLVVPHPLRVYFHKKGWMRMDRTEFATRWVLPFWCGTHSELTFKKTDSVKDDLKQRNTDVTVIPGGLTLVVQPLDKCLNKLFKDNVRQKYLTWITSGPFEFTPSWEEKGAKQKSCPLVDQGSIGRDTPRDGQQILQDLRYFQCLGCNRGWHGLLWGNLRSKPLGWKPLHKSIKRLL